MRKIISAFFMIAVLNSCGGGFGADNSIQTHNVDFNEKDIIGNWKLDKFSYEYLSEKENFDSICIFFNKDGTFILNNSGDLFNQKKADPEFYNVKKNGIIDNKTSNGKWKVTKYEKIGDRLNLIYDNNISQSGLNVYKKGDEYQIWYFFGDPDTGERLRFLKGE